MADLPGWPRLMTRSRAADYCDMSVTAFTARCPVPPLDFGDKRLERFDRLDLDAWIEARKNPSPGIKSVAEAMAEFKGEKHRPREAR